MTKPQQCATCGAPIPIDAPGGQCPQCLIQVGFESQTRASVEPEATADRSTKPSFVPPSTEQVARLFPQLEILEFLGAGGMGAVYKARQPRLDRLVAVKILPPEVGQDPAFAERFAREARSMARLSHPGIVAIHDFGETDGLFYFVMEFVDGANLRQTIQAGRLQPQQALAIVTQICDALQYAHDVGVMHRDIKPENILLDKRGKIKIADFGLSKLMHSGDKFENRGVDDVSLTDTHQVIGTLRYMAPEQLRSTKEVDHRADIYSLGVVIYELLTGDVPIGYFAPPSQKVHIDVRLDEIVLRALAEEPAKRYQQVSEVKTDVEVVRSTTPDNVTAEGVGRISAPRSTRGAPPQDNHAATAQVASILTAMGILMIGSAVFTFLLQVGVLIDTSKFDAFFRHDGVALTLLSMQCFAASIGILMVIAGRGTLPENSALPSYCAVLGMIPLTPVWLITMPLGIWVLVLLRHRADTGSLTT